MTVRSFLRDPQRPVVFLPVYFGYERIVEGSTYIGELSGKPKEKESIFGLLAHALRELRERFGHVHVNIGEPILLDDLLDRHDAEWRRAARRATTRACRGSIRAVDELARHDHAQHQRGRGGDADQSAGSHAARHAAPGVCPKRTCCARSSCTCRCCAAFRTASASP